MRHVTRPLALGLAGAVSFTGCATAHLKGEYCPQGVPKDAGTPVAKSDKQTLAEGHDWVLFWGIVELASSDLGDEAKGKLRADEVVTDTEVRNHISLPGALLWIVTAGIFSHHDLTLKGRVVTLKPNEHDRGGYDRERGDRNERTTSQLPAEQTIIIGGAGVGSSEGRGGSAGRDGSSLRGGSGMGEDGLFAVNTVDRPLSEVSRDFRDSAVRAGLIPVANVAWSDVGPAERNDMRGEIPENRLEGVPLSNVKTFLVTNYALANDIRKDPKCGTFLPGIVGYEKDGQTRLIYSRMSARLRMAEANGMVGEGKVMSRAQYEEHMGYARDFEASCQKLCDDLQSSSRSTRDRGSPSDRKAPSDGSAPPDRSAPSDRSRSGT